MPDSKKNEQTPKYVLATSEMKESKQMCAPCKDSTKHDVLPVGVYNFDTAKFEINKAKVVLMCTNCGNLRLTK